MERRGIAPTFVDGRRVTTAEVLEVVRASLAEVNARGLCGDRAGRGARSSATRSGFARSRSTRSGSSAIPSLTSPAAIEDALAAGRIPVVAPLAEGPLNVNADEAAAALAVGLGAERIVFVSDVPGVLMDGAVMGQIDVEAADRMLADGTFEGGIVPKLEAAVLATRGGVHAVIGATEVVA